MSETEYARFVDRARSTAMLDDFAASCEQIARWRREAKERGWELPDYIRAALADLRKLLHDSGVPWERVDTTPGLEPLD